MHDVTINGQKYVPGPSPRIMTTAEWSALERAERAFYTDGASMGTNGITDVCPRDESQLVAAVWDRCESSMDSELMNLTEGGSIWLARIAQRVARTFALMAFGPEMLLR